MHILHGYGSFWSMILMITFWVGLISLGVYLIKNYINDGKNEDTSLQIIKKRLAKGEIDETEYERLKTIIEQDGK